MIATVLSFTLLLLWGVFMTAAWIRASDLACRTQQKLDTLNYNYEKLDQYVTKISSELQRLRDKLS